MPISSQEASAALASIDQTERRAAVLKGYESGAPHLFLWGLIWIVGYGLGARYAMIYVAGTGTFIALALAIIVVMQPRTGAQIAALPALLVAAAYGVTGIFRGARWAILGVALGVLTVGGFLLLKSEFMLWMAAVGGGAILLGGFWLRSA